MRHRLGLVLLCLGLGGLGGLSAHARVANDPPGNCVLMDFNKNRLAKGETELTAFQKSPNCTSVQVFSRKEEFQKFLDNWRAKTGQDYPIQTFILSGHSLGDSYCGGNLTVESFRGILQDHPDSFANTSALHLLGCYAGAHMKHWREGLPNFGLGFGFEASSPLQSQGSPAWIRKAEQRRAALPATMNETVAHQLVQDLDTLGNNTSFTFGYVENTGGKKVFNRLGRMAGCNEMLDIILTATNGHGLNAYLEDYSMQIENGQLIPPLKEVPPDMGNTQLRIIYKQLQHVLANVESCEKIFSPVKYIRLFSTKSVTKDVVAPMRDRFVTLIHSQMVAENFRVCAGPWLNAVASKLSNCEPVNREDAALVRKFLGIPNPKEKPAARTALYKFLTVRNSDLRPLIQAATALLTADTFIESSWEKPLGSYKDEACKTFEFMNLQAESLTKCRQGIYPRFWTPWTEPKDDEAPTERRLAAPVPNDVTPAPHVSK